LAIHFKTNSTLAQYDEIWKRLEDQGRQDPQGRSYHVSWGDDGSIEVLDVWESQADFDAFGAVLMPILQDLGVEATPMIEKTHRIVVAP